jgi:hypothetical protein
MTEAQGQADGHDAANQMAAFAWDANKKIPVELDLESETYGGDPSGSLDYVRGWVSSVQADGYLAYVYTSPDAVNAIASHGIPVNGVTVAAWLWNDGEGHFENTTPNGDIGIGNNFSNHDRAWQYCGDISSDGIHVDCNVSDLLLAPAPGGSNGSGGSPPPPPPPPSPDACSEGSGFCTDTLQCDNGHWIVRQDDPAACTKIVNESISCGVGAGYCTATLQCDGGHWVPRQDDPASCTSGPGA